MRRPEVAQDAAHPRFIPAGQKCAGRLAEVARPDQMVASEIVVALAESPWNREAGDDAAGERRRLVAVQDGRADAIHVVSARPPLQRAQLSLPCAPSRGVIVEDCFERRLQGLPRVKGGFGGREAEAERKMREAVHAGRQLCRQSDVAVGGSVVLHEPAIVIEQLPSVRRPDEADGACEKRLVGRHRQSRAGALGEQHRIAFVFAAPAGVVGPAVDQMRRQQREQAQGAVAQVFEPDLHQHRVAARVADHALDDAETAAEMRAREQKSRHAVFERLHLRGAVPLFFGEEAVVVGDDESEVADAGLVDPRIVDFVEDAVADGEPDATGVGERRADSALGARGPSRPNSWRSGRLNHRFSPCRTGGHIMRGTPVRHADCVPPHCRAGSATPPAASPRPPYMPRSPLNTDNAPA